MREDMESAPTASARRGLAAVERTSMLPTLRPGDEVVVDLEAREVRRGDLVAFRDGEKLIVHRLIGTGPALRTRGDNAPSADAPFPPDRLVGPVVELRRDGRRRPYRTVRRRCSDRLLGELSRLSLARPRLGRLFRLALRCLT